MCPETKKERKKKKIRGGDKESHLVKRTRGGRPAAALKSGRKTTVISNKLINKMVSWIDSDRSTVTLDKTQTVNLSWCERSITTVLRQNRLYSTKSETRQGRRSLQKKKKKRRWKVASLCTPPPLKVFSVRSGNDRFGVYRVCN